ncbi:MAG: LexA family transcriptional regulator [Clostridia bacterium]|nr:LexA family transcriptional regulator [Clostridia bacterium]
MKRLIEFNYKEDSYILVENGDTVFSIKATDLKFNCVDFYSGLYKNKYPNVELVNKVVLDPYKKGSYIYNWLQDIISHINDSFLETQDDDEKTEENNNLQKIIKFYEFAACAGDGFFIDSNINYTEIPDPTGQADFAVEISGDSMEPTIMDKSIIYVKVIEELQHNDIGLFVVNGDVMCKRFIKQGRGYKLIPDNDSGEHKSFGKKDILSYKLLGKVLL